jgi:hypothetical protein
MKMFLMYFRKSIQKLHKSFLIFFENIFNIYFKPMFFYYLCEYSKRTPHN